jgi:hypothetical protein
LVVRPGGASELEDRSVRDLPDLLRAGDALVVNDTKVITARLTGRRIGRDPEPKIEATLVKRLDGSRWRAFGRPAKRLENGDMIRFGDEGKVCFLSQLDATVQDKIAGEVTLSFAFHGPVLDQAVCDADARLVKHSSPHQVAGGQVGKASKPKNFLESGYLKQADTIEGLAGRIGVDPAVLRATVDRWNGFVDKGVDEDFGRGAREYDKWLGDPFHRPNPSLGRIDKAPYYAVDMIPGDVSTYGGVLIDTKARVVKADGTPIAGLYACGVATASIMGGVYPGAGASVGPSMTVGYIAAKHAAGLDT